MKFAGVLKEIHACRMRRAWHMASLAKDFPADSLRLLKSLADGYEDCGNLSGAAFDLLRNGANKLLSDLIPKETPEAHESSQENSADD